MKNKGSLRFERQFKIYTELRQPNSEISEQEGRV
jgi:hypothetical protein